MFCKVKKIGIFSKTELQWDETSLKNGGLGGSETWVLEVSEHLSHFGYDVTIYSNPLTEHSTYSGVKFKYYEQYDDERFDVAIISRLCNIFNAINSDNIFCVAHDILLWEFTESMYNSPKLKGIGVLSEWHKKFLLEHFPFVDEKIVFFFGNGCYTDKYQNVQMQNKENAMVWSSCRNRGLEWIIKYTLPRIREKIPDFKIYVCYPNYDNTDNYISEGVINMGTLPKEELSELQKRSKIWIYPNVGHTTDGVFFYETFCITALENAMSKNIIITNDGGGLSTTLKGYDLLFSENDFDLNDIEGYCNRLADIAINILEDKEKAEQALNSYNKLRSIKNWEESARDLLIEIKRLMYYGNASFVMFEEYGRAFNDEIIDVVSKQVKRRKCLDYRIISSKNEKDRYYQSLDNIHHYTTKFIYESVFPIVSQLLNLPLEDINEDFHIVRNVKDDGDFSFAYPKIEKKFTVLYGKKHFLNKKTGLIEIFPTTINGGYNILYGEQMNGVDFRNGTNYHRLYCLSHYSSIITNNSENNGLTLLISGDSHMIPLVPIFAYYFKKVIYLDNRDNISYRWLWKDENPDLILFAMGTSTYHNIAQYLEQNFK